VILTLAFRSLFSHPVRSAVLAAGFGLGVAVMAILLGVGRVVLEQARAPELAGGGDILVTGGSGSVVAARAIVHGALAGRPFDGWTRAASPWSRATLYLVDGGPPLAVRARGGIPSLERALGDSEVAGQPWRDAPSDRPWAAPTPDDLLRLVDRFHPIPDVPHRQDSWAEWLYFNGRAAGTRFYLTFLVGPRPPGDAARRAAVVRLQIDRGSGTESFGASALLDDAAVSRAPELSIGGNGVRLDGARYRIALDLRDAGGRQARGDLVLGAAPERLVPPFEIFGAAGWRTGYVVPVVAGPLSGSLDIDGDRVPLDGGTGYHDHNWGFWEGVSWQWGQVHHGDTSFVFGRVFPPPDAADPGRMPGLVGALGPDGPLGYATDVSIEERNDAAGRPLELIVRGASESLDLTLTFAVEDVVVSRMQDGPLAAGLDFLQLRGRYDVRGRIGTRDVAFAAPGAAETFRGAPGR
jgi:hypothetical protein